MHLLTWDAIYREVVLRKSQLKQMGGLHKSTAVNVGEACTGELHHALHPTDQNLSVSHTVTLLVART